MYNKTIGKSTPFRATVHDMVTGQLGTKAWAVAFIRAHPIGERFKCLVDISNLPWYAALPDQPLLQRECVVRSSGARRFLSVCVVPVHARGEY